MRRSNPNESNETDSTRKSEQFKSMARNLGNLHIFGDIPRRTDFKQRLTTGSSQGQLASVKPTYATEENQTTSYKPTFAYQGNQKAPVNLSYAYEDYQRASVNPTYAYGENQRAMVKPTYGDNLKAPDKPMNTYEDNERGQVKPMFEYEGKQMSAVHYPPPLMSIDTQHVSRSSSAQKHVKDEAPPIRRVRHSSAQRSKKVQNRDRYRSVDRNFSRMQYQNARDQDNVFDQKGNMRDTGKQQSIAPTAENVFNFMVKNMNGKGNPQEVKLKSKLFPKEVDVNDWFRRNKDRFTLIERDEQIRCVFVYDKRVTWCIDYSKRDSCKKSDCNRYHICKNICAGKCKYGRTCNFSHNCFDEHNEKISIDLGLIDKFSNDEICIILRFSFPHVCSKWALKGECRDPNCGDLHMCPRFILGKCKNGPTCPNIHDRSTDHNKAILQAFDMTGMKYVVFKWRVFMVHNPAWMRDDRENASNGQRVDLGVQEETDEVGEAYICADHIIDECRDRSCKHIHSKNKLPYVWQINVFDAWISLEDSGSIEEKYTDLKRKSDVIQMTFNELDLAIEVYFSPVIQAYVSICGSGERPVETQARRLSTMSYINKMSSLAENDEGKVNKFYTQWRWYWMDDYKQCNLYEPDAFQYTLEVKYLAKQSLYRFWREDYVFSNTLSFDKMTQLNDATRKRRPVMRRPVFVSPEEVTRRETPPSLSAVTLFYTPLPESWMPWDLVQPFELVDITFTRSDELDTIVKLFHNSIGHRNEKIDRICRVQNPKLWELFTSEESAMKTKATRIGYNSNSVNKKFLFHGTGSEDAVRGICVNNFDIRVSGKFGTSYGEGAYFARDANYSHCYTKGPIRYMFVANVLVGRFAKGDKSYRRPPEIPGRSHQLYDSCVNDITDPSIFVLFDRNQYYPQYLIQYHDIDQSQDDINALKIKQQKLPQNN